MVSDLETVVAVAGAALGGLAVGVEREWSSRARGSAAHFAGIRTFTLLGGLAGLAGTLWQIDAPLPAVTLLGGAALLIVVAYAAASRRTADGTTEVAALVVLAAGFLAGMRLLAFASGVIAVTVLLLAEKSRLHGLVHRLNDEEIRAGARFAVMAVVILPLLPSGPYGPFGGIRPQGLWALVLLFAGLSFLGYIARRTVGEASGYPLAGLLGGLISSTQITLLHARASRAERPEHGMALACGAVAASAMLFVRTATAAAILNPALANALLPYAVPGCVVGGSLAAVLLRRARSERPAPERPSHPLQLRTALQMALLFQVVLTLAFVLRERFGRHGLIATAIGVGATEVDAVTIAMARAIADGTAVQIAAQALAVGMATNTLFKLALAAAIGRGVFRRATVTALAVMAAGLAVPIALLWR